MRFFLSCLIIAILFIVMEVLIASAQYRILFIHHSCGSNLFAADNGNLSQELTNLGFDVHNVTYGNKIGQETNVFHCSTSGAKENKKDKCRSCQGI